MDELTAYQILGLPTGSSIQEIKEAYATLSKEFHPEESPEEFQRIHEAYTVLTRKNRHTPVSIPNGNIDTPSYCESFPTNDILVRPKAENQSEYSNDEKVWRELEQKANDIPQQIGPKEEKNPMGDNFDNVVNQARMKHIIHPDTESSKNNNYDFDSALSIAERQEQEQLNRQAQMALTEIRILFEPEYRHKLKLFKALFSKNEYQAALKTPVFLHEFTNLLREIPLKKCIYDFIYDYYRLRGVNPSRLSPAAKDLFIVLQQHRDVNAKRKATIAYAIPGVLAAAHQALNGTDISKDSFAALCILVVLAIGCIWCYKKLYENHSSIASQAIIASALMMLQIVLLLADLGEVADGIAIPLFLIIFVWLVILGILAIIFKIKDSIRQNHKK